MRLKLIAGLIVGGMLLSQLILMDDSFRVGDLSERRFIITHRGDMKSYPEQTMEAYEFALSKGIRIMECDARRTMDGMFVAIHDDSWDRTTNGSGSVSSTSWYGYGEHLDAGSWFRANESDARVPTMERLMDWAHDKGVFLWIDCYFSMAYDSEFQSLIEDTDMKDSLTVQFVVETGQYVRASSYEGYSRALRVAVPLTQTIYDALGYCEKNDIGFLTIPWEMGEEEIYTRAYDSDIRVLLFSYNTYRADDTYMAEYQKGAWGCFTDDAIQAGRIQGMIA